MSITGYTASALRSALGGRLPRLLAKYHNRTASILPSSVDGWLWPGTRMRFDLSDVLQRTLFLQGMYFEVDDIRLTSEACKSTSSTFLDIGANIGVYSFYVSKDSPETKIFAFEPNPKTCEKIRETIRLNSITNISLQEVALSDHSGEAEMTVSEINSGWSTLGNNETIGQSHKVSVRQQSFDEWWSNDLAAHGGSFVIKMDVEGYETKILKGMKSFLSKATVPLLLIEFLELTLRNAGSSPDELYATLVELGFVGYSDPERKNRINCAPPCADPVNLYFVKA